MVCFDTAGNGNSVSKPLPSENCMQNGNTVNNK